MKIAFVCPECSRESVLDVGQTMRCPSCGHLIGSVVSESIGELGLIDTCCLCGNDQFYVQKDFNRTLGLAIVLLSVLLSYVIFGFNLLALILGLTVCAVIDFVLYKILPEVTICYACHSVYREYSKNPNHKPFDLNIAEQYEQHRFKRLS